MSVTVRTGGFRSLGRRTRKWGERLTQEWQMYFLTPMISKEGYSAQYPLYAYTIHLIMACFSEAAIRVVLSFVFVMALAGVNGGVINFTAAALAKGLVLGGCIMILGKISAYSRLENVLASWWPSSPRMFSTGSIQPYADAIHVVCYAIFQYAGSLLGLAIAMWVSNSFTMNLGQPSTTADTFGLFGTYTVTTSDLWLVEIFGSTILTFAWLMLVVHRHGAKHHIYVGLAMGFIFSAVALVTLPASGANFDFIHYAALRTVLANKNTVNTSHTAAYFVGPLIGFAIAWVGYIIVASMAFAGGYTRPGRATMSPATREAAMSQRRAPKAHPKKSVHGI